MNRLAAHLAPWPATGDALPQAMIGRPAAEPEATIDRPAAHLAPWPTTGYALPQTPIDRPQAPLALHPVPVLETSTLSG
jgi:hypothetical protein